jgi:hypothetical protein
MNIMNLSDIQQKSMVDYSNVIKGESGGKQVDSSEKGNSFISNIQREKDASYAVYN